MKSLYLFLVASFCISWAYAENKAVFNKSEMDGESCLSQEMVADVLSDFTLADLPGGAGSLCDANNIKNKMVRGLVLLKYGKFNFPTRTDSIYKGTFNASNTPYKFLRDRIKQIEFASCSDSTAGYAHQGSDRFFVCANRAELPADYYAELAVHEARHIDYNDQGHVTCTQGGKKGTEGGCDVSIGQRGGYYFGLEYDILVAKYGANFHPALRSSARAYAVSGILNSFNEIPKLATVQYTLAISENNEVIYFGSDERSFKVPVKAKGPIMNTGDGSFIYQNENNKAIVFDAYIGARSAYAEHIYEIVNFQLKDAQYVLTETSVLEAGLGDQSLSLYYRDYAGGELRTIKATQALPSADVEKFLSPTQCSAAKATAAYLLTKRGNVYEANLQNGKVVFTATSACNLDYLDAAQVGSTKLRISMSGELLKKKLFSWKPIPEYRHLRFKSLSKPYDFYTQLQVGR
jgi:hypothetical protein